MYWAYILNIASQRALALGHEAARSGGANAVEPEHLLVGLLRGFQATASRDAEMARYASEAGISEVLARLNMAGEPNGHGGDGRVLDPSPALETLIRALREQARSQQRHQLLPIDLLDALIGEDSTDPVKKKLVDLGAKQQDLHRAVTLLRNKGAAGPKARNLRKFSRCLTDLAREGLLDPVIGRDQEVRRLMQVLCRRVKNNPVLIGRPGVGKRAIVEGLAQRIAAGQAPPQLAGAGIFALDLPALSSGADYRGVFEERMKGALEDIREARGQIILFIDELHNALKGGSATDAGAALKHALAGGELRCIGVTTLDEYRLHIEKDGALERRFQPIIVEEPSAEETVTILWGLRPRYEAHHEIRITDEALAAAAKLSHRFVMGRALPDKAIDLVDEAAAKVRIENEALPIEVEASQRRAERLAEELRAMEPGNGPRLRSALSSVEGRPAPSRLEHELAGLESGVRRDRTDWEAQRAIARRIGEGRGRLAWRRMVLAFAPELGWTAEAQQKARAALAELETGIHADEAKLAELQRSHRLCKVDLDEEDIAHVVASWTGIPLRKLVENERAKLLQMEEKLHERIVGQDQAVRAVSNAVRLARAGMKDPNRPVGSFLFLGPTGVGKTELSRALAEFLFDDEAAMVRIDMSEYMEKHTVSRLVGAPPGYIGYEDSGQLTEAVRRKPYSVVLFDEIEKAHPDVFNLLLQIMDDGRLTDGHGRTVDFKNAILIMTSNVGGRLYHEQHGKPAEDLEQRMTEALRLQFRPEFLNRIDAIVRFDQLQFKQIQEIVEIQVRLINRRLAPGGIRLEVDSRVKTHLAEAGFDPLQGARPLKRLIQQDVLEPLALRVLQGEFVEGDVVAVSMRNGKQKGLAFKK